MQLRYFNFADIKHFCMKRKIDRKGKQRNLKIEVKIEFANLKIG